MMMEPAKSLKESLVEHARAVPADLWKPEPAGKPGAVRCVACGHRCLIYDGLDGICKVRHNRGGRLRVPWGYVGGLQVDPIEKKPFFHVTPGEKALSFGMLGCDFHCAYCQNWLTSQALRDPGATGAPQEISPREIVALTRRAGASVLTSTYNEPLITSEWAVEIFREGKGAGLRTSYVSNGNATPEVLEYLRPHVDLYKIDLKSFDDKHYRQLGGLLTTVLDSIRRVHRMGFWLEIVTLVIPGFNDSSDELKRLCEFLVSVSPDIPWHATAFHKDYRMTDPDDTSVETLLRAAEIGRASGLNFIYLGNLPGRVGEWENTYCPHCRELLVERHGYRILKNSMTDAQCPGCQRSVPGIWR